MGASSNSSLFFWGVGGVIKVRYLPKIAILRNKSASRGYIRPRLGELRPDIIMVDIQTRVGGVSPPDLAPRGAVGGVIRRENAQFSRFWQKRLNRFDLKAHVVGLST